jgi:hypothetical protein
MGPIPHIPQHRDGPCGSRLANGRPTPPQSASPHPTPRPRSLANETVTVDEAKAVYPFMAIGANIALVGRPVR